jgi:predicted RNA-binding protein with EMAP domain
MRRLIDESTLKKSIEKWLNPDQIADRMVDLENITVSVMMEIEEQPTAYDVDKVVEQLEDRKSLMLETFKISESDIDRGRIYGIDKAIEIVKGGGVDA